MFIGKSHIAHNLKINAENSTLKVINGKFVGNYFISESACNNIPISEADSDESTIYGNYYGTVSDFQNVLSTLYPAMVKTGSYANLNNKWLSGNITGTSENRNILQTLTTQEGTEFKRQVKGTTYSDWLVTPVIKAERKVLNGSTFHVDSNAWGLLFITSTGTVLVAIYVVRFGIPNEPLKIYSSYTRD